MLKNALGLNLLTTRFKNGSKILSKIGLAI